MMRLLNHYKANGKSLVPLCTEYISKKSLDADPPLAVDALSMSQSAPVVKESRLDLGSDVPIRPLKRRRFTDVSRAHNTVPSDAQLQALRDALQTAPSSCSDLSAPGVWLTLPFPFIFTAAGLPYDRFAFHAVRDQHQTRIHTFDWMGREVFPHLIEAVTRLRDADPSAAFLQGPIGVGKSHLLAALVIFLRRQGHVVVYVPHCRDLVHSPIAYMAAALLCTFNGPSSEDEDRRRAIRSLTSTQEIETWCKRQSDDGIFFYFVIDQLDGLEAEKMGMAPPSRCDAVKSFLLSLYSHCKNVCVTSASANGQHEYSYSLLGHGQREAVLNLKLTLTEAECQSWFAKFKPRLPTFEAEELEWFHDHVGRIFLFYSSLMGHSDIAFSDAWPEIRDAPVLQAARVSIHQFAAHIATNKRPLYYAGLNAILTGTSTLSTPVELIDHDFCVIDGSRGRITCGLARRELFTLLENYDRNVAHSKEWLDQDLSDAIDSPPVLSFLVGRSIITSMLSGVVAADIIKWSAVPKHTLAARSRMPRDLPSSLIEAGTTKSLLIVPEVYNFNDIDCLFIKVDNVLKTVHVVPIQITIAQERKDSTEGFYSQWAEWQAKFPNYALTSTFLWVVEHLNVGLEVHTPAAVRPLRRGDKTRVAYSEHFIHIRDIAPRVWESLSTAREKRRVMALEQLV
ncbi:hypothetical protein C8J57DRAFT_205606 [Mycena rebaudengoi]|nr:hypothetical protein C8J57DRAFT_205606 [Mycena rebaudengoi]